MTGKRSTMLWLCRAALLKAALALPVIGASGAAAQDIVGSWVGRAAGPDQTEGYPVRLTFVSPTGGVSRYPSDPVCGGILQGDQKGDYFEYEEKITFGGKDERDDGCIPGTMKLTVEGDTMKYEWSGVYNGQDFAATGELHRDAGRKGR